MEPTVAPPPPVPSEPAQSVPADASSKELKPEPEALKEHVTSWNLAADVAVRIVRNGQHIVEGTHHMQLLQYLQDFSKKLLSRTQAVEAEVLLVFVFRLVRTRMF
jgi:hypothetical protein